MLTFTANEHVDSADDLMYLRRRMMSRGGGRGMPSGGRWSPMPSGGSRGGGWPPAPSGGGWSPWKPVQSGGGGSMMPSSSKWTPVPSGGGGRGWSPMPSSGGGGMSPMPSSSSPMPSTATPGPSGGGGGSMNANELNKKLLAGHNSRRRLHGVPDLVLDDGLIASA